MLVCAIHMSSLTPLVVQDVESAQWDDVADLVVVGLGAAGVTAAVEARERGADVMLLDRFTGGGATAISGGVYYAGGGTHIQEAAGVAIQAASASVKPPSRRALKMSKWVVSVRKGS